MLKLMRRIARSLRPDFYLYRSQARKAARDFAAMMRAYDDAIEFARARHRSTASLRQAKADFVHACLANDNAKMALLRHPQAWRGAR